ncbi:MAG TPA: zinc dependent phospholipase C family protein [Puia sp.]|nr:zinc dependent phospholipase C family protein [Puia sp.]
MKKTAIILACLLCHEKVFCWGFYAHQKINFFAVFLLPPEMMVLYKPNISFLSEHAVDPDKRRYSLAAEAPRHYIDIDHYGPYPFAALPRKWDDAVMKFPADSLQKYGIVVWWIPIMEQRLTKAFREKDQTKILRLSAEIGHYIADAHVPLHVCSNHNGQLTDQQGIHAFWESRIPEMLAEKEWDFFIGKAEYISRPTDFIWKRILESAAAADTVLRYERALSHQFRDDRKYAFEDRNGVITRQYSSAYALAYNGKLNNMIERRMRASIYAIASFWYTAWIDAGQPDLKQLIHKNFSSDELREFETLNAQWKNGRVKGVDREE